ncbi:LysM peptidoglycan-binding domain-containing protein [bacterium]|nr:LysM peptidoglycan-binding domain-containing protein [bacterium]
MIKPKSHFYRFILICLLILVSGCAYNTELYRLETPETKSDIHALNKDKNNEIEKSKGNATADNAYFVSSTIDPKSLKPDIDPNLIFSMSFAPPFEYLESKRPATSNYMPDSGYPEIEENGAPFEEIPVTGTDPIQERQFKLDEALRLCQQAQQEWEEDNPDMALETLDSAYELLASVETNGDAEIFQQKEDIRFLISKRIIEIYASRQTVINGKHSEIPLILNPHVEKEIQNFLGKDKRVFMDSYIRSGIYRPMILNELNKAGIPDRLSWLPLIESGFQVKALSRARALGLWQFIPSTGYKFGLERNRWVDERMDPVKSTKAAIEYLTQLHHIFGDWTTALAAYNCGEGAVLKVIRKQHINYLDNFWDLYTRLPSETAQYVPKFMAALHLIENPDKYGIELPATLDPIEHEEIAIKKRIRLSDLASKIGADVDELINLNPELRYKVTPDEDYVLKVPKNKGEIALASIDKISQWSSPEIEVVYHRVKKGETLSHIAKKYRLNVNKIAQANNIKKADSLRIGQMLKIPLRVADNNLLSLADSDDRVKSYSVKSGDCAYDIATMHKMKLNEFLSLNNLTPESLIYPGQKVLVKVR